MQYTREVLERLSISIVNERGTVYSYECVDLLFLVHKR